MADKLIACTCGGQGVTIDAEPPQREVEWCKSTAVNLADITPSAVINAANRHSRIRLKRLLGKNGTGRTEKSASTSCLAADRKLW